MFRHKICRLLTELVNFRVLGSEWRDEQDIIVKRLSWITSDWDLTKEGCTMQAEGRCKKGCTMEAEVRCRKGCTMETQVR